MPSELILSKFLCKMIILIWDKAQASDNIIMIESACHACSKSGQFQGRTNAPKKIFVAGLDEFLNYRVQ